jgi:4-hydroxybenzoate polyprenyltransferase
MMLEEIYLQERMQFVSIEAFCRILLQGLERLFNFLTVSSLLIALTGFFQTLGGYILLDIPVNHGICFAVFLMTFSVYSANKLTDIEEDAINRPDRADFLEGREEIILFLSIYAFLISALITYASEHIAILILFIPFIANCFYSIRLHPRLPRLKDIPFVKNIVVGLSWALVCTLMPLCASNPDIDSDLIISSASVIYLMLIKDFINSTLCDLKDMSGDMENGVQTIPVVLGLKKTRQILLALNSSLMPLLILARGKIIIIFSLLILTEYLFIIGFGESSKPAVLESFIDGEWLITCLLLYGTGLLG